MKSNFSSYCKKNKRIVQIYATPYFPIFAVSCAIAALQPAAAVPAVRDNVYTYLSDTVVTPHIDWAPKFAGETLKTLIIAPAWGQREAVELSQRFDIECEPLMTQTSSKLAGITYGSVQYMTPALVAERFDAALASRQDVVVVGHFDWQLLHIEHRYRILQKVYEEGVGIVFVQPVKNEELSQLFSKNPAQKADQLSQNIPWQKLKAFQGHEPSEIIRTGTFGRGRWVALHYKTNSTNQSLTPAAHIPWLPEEHWEYEYYQSLLANVLLWASKRDIKSELDLENFLPVYDAAKPPVRLTVTARLQNEIPQGLMRGVIHMLKSNQQIPMRNTPVQFVNGRGRTQLTLPELNDGEYILNLFLESNNETLAWRSFPFTLTAEPAIEIIEVDDFKFNSETPVTGKVKLARRLQEKEELYIELWDNHDRLLQQKELQGDRFAFTPVQPLETSIHRIKAKFYKDKKLLLQREATISISGRERPAFHLSIWEENEVDYISALWYKQFRNLGVDAIFYRIDRPHIQAASRLIAEADLFGAPMFACYTTKVEDSPHGPVHSNCLHDPEYLHSAVQESKRVARVWAKYDVLHYGDGSDKHMHGNCFSDKTLAAFQDFLQTKYDSLEVLNQMWSESFASWPDVIPKTQERAKADQNFCSWIEHTRFMESSYAEFTGTIGAALKKIDPQALLGPDGYGRINSRDGSDWMKLLPQLGFYNLYTYQDAPQLEITRSLSKNHPNVKLRSIYYGSYSGQFANEAFMRRIPWYALLHDYNGLFWWSANGKTTWPASCGRLAGPDLCPTESYIISKQGIDEIRNGLIHLISSARRENDGIAMLYDQTAVHAASAYSHPSYVVRSLASFQDLLSDLGLQYDYVTVEQLEAKELESDKFRLLILPYSLAMAPKTAAAVRAFVMNGGFAVANILPAQYDDLLRIAAKGSLLSDLFSESDMPVSVGKGKTLLRNNSIIEYAAKRYKSEGDAMRDEFKKLLKNFAIEPAVRISAKDAPALIPGLEVVRYTDADQQYIGFLNHTAEPLRFSASLGEKHFVTDMRQKKRFGETSQLALNLVAGDCALYAVTSIEFQDAAIEVAQDETAVGENLPVVVTMPAQRTGSAAIILDVIAPDGKSRKEYRKVILVQNPAKSATHKIPFALNDPPGKWTLNFSDAITGRVQKQYILLRLAQ